MVQTLQKYDDSHSYKHFLKMFISALKERVDKYKKTKTFIDFCILQNYLTFLMIITLNLKNKKTFIRRLFKGKNHFIDKILEIIFPLENNDKLLGILNNIFFSEYKDLFFKSKGEEDEELEKLFIEEQTKFLDKYNYISSFYEDNTYQKMFSILQTFSISYDNFFKNYEKAIKEEDELAFKLCISQSVIRVAFSKEKTKYVSNDQSANYEFNFLATVIEKDMKETKEKFGDEFKTLFRKEDLCDDIIKYIFFIFGNTMMIEGFIKPLSNIFDIKKEPNRDVTKKEFNYIMNQLVENLTKTMPTVIKILLKLVYINVLKVFTIAEDDYRPLYTLLIFNFIISPRVQTIFGIATENSSFVRSLNRLIGNSCYNKGFGNNERLSEFNDLIKENHLKMKKFIIENIMNLNENDSNIQKSLSELFTEKNIIYPKFLFYWDSKLLCSSINGGIEDIISYEVINHEKKEK